MPTLTVSPKGWVVIPKDLRAKYDLKPGSRVAILDYGGVLALAPIPSDPVAALAGMFAQQGGASWTEVLAREHRATLLTGDPEFQAVEGDVAVEWLSKG
jgi:AbrB family looped-hinge helix DNA binding protein